MKSSGVRFLCLRCELDGIAPDSIDAWQASYRTGSCTYHLVENGVKTPANQPACVLCKNNAVAIVNDKISRDAKRSVILGNRYARLGKVEGERETLCKQIQGLLKPRY